MPACELALVPLCMSGCDESELRTAQWSPNPYSVLIFIGELGDAPYIVIATVNMYVFKFLITSLL